MRLDQLFHSLKEVGGGDQILRRSRRLHRGKVALPVEGWRQRLNLLQRHFVVQVLGIAADNDVHGGVGQLGFHGQHGLGIGGGLGLGFAAQLQQAGHVFHVFVANLF